MTVLRLEPAEPDGAGALADRDELARVFDRLSIDHRTIVVLHHYLGMTVEEAATTIGIPVGTAKSRLHYATDALRAALEADARSDADSKGPGMTTRPDPDRLIAAWLQGEAPDRAPERLLTASRDRIRTTSQRRAVWPTRRFAAMSTLTKFAMTAATVAVVAIVGISLMSGPGAGVAVPTGSPQPSASPSVGVGPTPSPSLSPSPTAASVATPRLYRSAPDFLEPGEYLLDYVFDRSIKMSIPAYWTGLEHGQSNALIVKTRDRGAFGTVGNTVLLGIYAVTGVYRDPCRDRTPASPAPTSVDGFADSLRHAVGMTGGKVTDTIVGGVPAKVFDLSNSIVAETCEFNPFNQWTFNQFTVGSGQGNGTSSNGHQRIWLLEVDGTILLIDAQGSTLDGVPKVDADELYAIVMSIKFD